MLSPVPLLWDRGGRALPCVGASAVTASSRAGGGPGHNTQLGSDRRDGKGPECSPQVTTGKCAGASLHPAHCLWVGSPHRGSCPAQGSCSGPALWAWWCLSPCPRLPPSTPASFAARLLFQPRLRSAFCLSAPLTWTRLSRLRRQWPHFAVMAPVLGQRGPLAIGGQKRRLQSSCQSTCSTLACGLVSLWGALALVFSPTDSIHFPELLRGEVREYILSRWWGGGGGGGEACRTGTSAGGHEGRNWGAAALTPAPPVPIPIPSPPCSVPFPIPVPPPVSHPWYPPFVWSTSPYHSCGSRCPAARPGRKPVSGSGPTPVAVRSAGSRPQSLEPPRGH